MVRTSEGDGEVIFLLEAVQFLLRSYGTANSFREAVLALRDVRQTENEHEYSARFAKVEVCYGKTHTQDEKKKLFIDSLFSASRAIVKWHRETHDDETHFNYSNTPRLKAIHIEDNCTTGARVIIIVQVTKPMKRGTIKSSHEGVFYAEPFDGLHDPTGQVLNEKEIAFMLIGEHDPETLTSIPTTDLPSTQFGDTGNQKDPMLASNQGCRPLRKMIPATAISYLLLMQAAGHRPRWEAPRRSLTKQVIFRTCYDPDKPHYAPYCLVPFREKAHIKRNYERLTHQKRALVPLKSYLRATSRNHT